MQVAKSLGDDTHTRCGQCNLDSLVGLELLVSFRSSYHLTEVVVLVSICVRILFTDTSLFFYFHFK